MRPRPVAFVRVVLRTAKFPAASAPEGSFAYVVAEIGGRKIGRSAAFSPDSTSVDLAKDVAGFWRDVRVDPGQGIKVVVRRVVDVGDGKPQVASFETSIASPWATKEYEESKDGFELAFGVGSVALGLPENGARVPREAEGSDKTVATVGKRRIAVVTIEDVVGLYRPTGTCELGKPGANRVEGYVGDDDVGRIFLLQGIDGKRTSKPPLIDVHVAVEWISGSPPPGLTANFYVIDVDDASDLDPGVHHTAAAILDPNDWADGKLLGARGADNRGEPPAEQPRFNGLDGYRIWRSTPGVAYVEVKPGKVEDGRIKNGTSKVQIRCPDGAGDSFRIYVELSGADKEMDVFGDLTGILTMWNRFDVETLVMEAIPPARDNPGRPAAASLAGAVGLIPQAYDPAFVQLDFAKERPAPALDPLNAPDSKVSDTKAMNDYLMTNFTKRESPGWLCAVSAHRLEKRPAPTPSGPEKIITFTGRLRSEEKPQKELVFWRPDEKSNSADGASWFVWPKARELATRPAYASIRWGKFQVLFDVEYRMRMVDPPGRPGQPQVLQHEYVFKPHTIFPTFSADDHGQYFEAPREVWPSDYGAPMRTKSKDHAVVIVYAKNSSGGTSGQTPTLAEGDKQFFWGCVFLFEAPEKSPETAAITLAHELVHGLGLPHKCSRWNLHTPREKTCAMNYSNEGLLSDDGKTIAVGPAPDEVRSWQQPVGTALCAQHIRELRRLDLLKHRFLWRW